MALGVSASIGCTWLAAIDSLQALRVVNTAFKDINATNSWEVAESMGVTTQMLDQGVALASTKIQEFEAGYNETSWWPGP